MSLLVSFSFSFLVSDIASDVLKCFWVAIGFAIDLGTSREVEEAGVLRKDFDREQSGMPRITLMVGVAMDTLG